ARQAAGAELGRRALEGTDPAELKQAAVTLVVETLGVEHSSVLEFVAEEDFLRLTAGVGWPEGSIGRRFPTSQGASLAAFTFQNGGGGGVGGLPEEKRVGQPPGPERPGAGRARSRRVEGNAARP